MKVAFLLLFLVSCGRNEAASGGLATPLPTPTRLVGGLMPTFTPISRNQGALPTQTAVFNPDPLIPNSTVTAPPTLPPDQLVVSLRYALPALNLDRTLNGTANGQIAIYDQTADRTASSGQQGSILSELIPALSAATLEPLPDSCPNCLFLSYELPLTGETREGWLRDPRLAASLENYLSIALGPHFPPNSIIGLRRSASAYAPAHSLALTANGRLFQWSATQDRINSDESSDFTAAELQSALNRLPLARLQDSYVVDCALSPNELLYLRAGETSRAIQIVCPEFSLPDTLLPLYVQMDELMAAELGEAYAPPPAIFPLSGLITYQRAEDDTQLTMLMDGSVIISSPTFSQTTPITTVISTAALRNLQLDLLATGVLTTGLTSFYVDPETDTTLLSRLLVRGEEGVYDAVWETLPETAVFATLNTLLDDFLSRN